MTYGCVGREEVRDSVPVVETCKLYQDLFQILPWVTDLKFLEYFVLLFLRLLLLINKN